MSDLLAGLDALAWQYSTVSARVVVSLLAVALAAIVGWGVTRLRRRTGDTVQGAVVDLLASIVAAGAAVVAVAVIVGVWGQIGTVAFALEQANVGPSTLARILLTVGLLAGTFVLVRFLERLLREVFGGHDAVSEHQLEVTYRITQVGSYLLAGVIALGFWQVDLSGLLIGAGVLGAILGLAAQQTLASVFSGFVLMFSRPFEVGDWVAIGDREGIVSDITIVSTRIQTFDGEYAIIPNDEVSSRTVTNRSRKGRLRLRVSVGVDYDTNLDRAEAVIREATADLDALMRVPAPQVIIREFGDSAIVFEVRFWIDKPSSRRRWRAKRAVIKAVKAAFDREGIKIPYPQRELVGRAETGGFRIADERRAADAAEPTAQTDGSGNRDEQR